MLLVRQLREEPGGGNGDEVDGVRVGVGRTGVGDPAGCGVLVHVFLVWGLFV